MFKAEHADRLARVLDETELSAGDLQFRWWNHMMVFLHAETYYHHYELKLMPTKHWSGYVKYVRGYLDSPGVREFWDDVGDAFSVDFSNWISSQLDDMGSQGRRSTYSGVISTEGDIQKGAALYSGCLRATSNA